MGTRAAALLLAVAVSAPAASRTVGAAPGKALRVRVVDHAGAPAAGAEVLFVNYRREGGRLTYRCDAAGTVAIPEAKLPGRLFVAAPGNGLGTAKVRAGAPIAFRLQVARAVTGRVHSPGGGPAVGVAVRVWAIRERQEIEPGTVWWVGLPRSLSERYAARTDAEGRFRIEGMPPGEVVLEVADPRFVTLYPEVGDDPVGVRLNPGCRVRGTLRHEGAGLAGWRIIAQPTEWAIHLQEATTGADGSFVLTGISPGSYDVVAVGPEDAPCVAPAVRCDLTKEKPEVVVAMRATAGTLLTLRVANQATKEPVPGVLVSICGAHLPFSQGNTVSPAVTGPDGTLRVRVPAGEVRVTMLWHPPGYLDPAEDLRFTVHGDVAETIVLPLDPGKWLAGRVLRADGKAAAGAVVTASRDGMELASATAGADGSFRLQGLPDAEVRLTASLPGESLPAPLTLRPPFPTDLRLRLRPR